MRREWTVPLLALSLAGCSLAPAAKPCTTCPNVAGNYAETTQSVAVTASTCQKIGWLGMTDVVQVTQSSTTDGDGGTTYSPTLTITTESEPSPFTGTLNTDNSVTLAGIPAIDVEEDLGTLGLGGDFVFTGGKVSGFNGTYDFVRTSDRCSINSIPTQWLPQ